MSMQFASKVPLGRLYKKTGKSGHDYFVGHLGQARLVIFRDFDQPEGDNQDESYTMWIENPDKAKKAAQAKGGKA